MSLSNPDAPSASHPSPWPARAGAARVRPRGRAFAYGLIGAFSAVVLAAWAVPPALNWGRFRTTIASIAAARLGRPVVISGEVTLRLLPEAVLTATGVVLPDQGDGVSAELSTLRLQIAVLPLLAGRIRPRDLVLGAAVLRLPWPLPDSLTHSARGRVPHAFAAHIENGTLRVGQVELTGINAGIHDGPEPTPISGLLPDANAAGFGAEGFTTFAGRSWRFTGALGIPDADGVSALDFALSGQGAASGTDGVLQGTVADGVVQGRLYAGGPDLSLLTCAPKIAWRANAPLTASGASVEAPSIAVTLGGVPASASLALHVAGSPRLDGWLHAASLDLDEWTRLLGARAKTGVGGNVGPAMLSGRIDVAADTARLLGGTVEGLHGALVFDGTSLLLDHAGGTLPGPAKLELSGTVTRSAGLLRISGPSRLEAPNLHATLQALHRLAPALIDALPSGVLRSATLTGTVTAGPGLLSVSKMTGQLDGTGVSGEFGLGLAARPNLDANLVLDRMVLDDWVNADWLAPGAFARAAQSWSSFDSDIHFTAAEGKLRSWRMRDLVLEAHGGASGLVVRRADGTFSGMRVTLSGAVGPDGALSNGRLAATTAEAAEISNGLPASLRWSAGLWRGPASMEATLTGPPGAIAAELRADIGDLVAEAELRTDSNARTAYGSITLRHPGAPRLLALLGVSGAEQWLSTGSVALRGQVAVRSGHVSVQDFDLIAADLQLGGSLDVDLTGTEPFVRGAIDAGRLALPGWTNVARLDPGWLRGWAGQLHVTANKVTIGLWPAAQSGVADLGLQSGIGLLDVTRAFVAGDGRLVGQVAVSVSDAETQISLHSQATGLHVTGPLTGLPIDLAAGTVDAVVDADSRGFALDNVNGTATLALHDARLTGLDLAAALRSSALPRAQGRQALLTALSHGATAAISGVASVDLRHQTLRLAPTALVSDDGTITAEGRADPAGLAMRLDLKPSIASVTQAGPWGAIKTSPDLGTAGNAPRPKHKRH